MRSKLGGPRILESRFAVRHTGPVRQEPTPTTAAARGDIQIRLPDAGASSRPVRSTRMQWTLDKLRALSLKQREVLFDNARAQGGPDAEQVIGLLVEHDLLVREGGGLARDHPVIQQMEEIIRSPEGRRAAREAADSGLPSMAGVDPLLAAGLGSSYGEHDTTSWAGTLTAEVMAEAGYVQTRKAAMPQGCVAKTAAFFEKRA